MERRDRFKQQLCETERIKNVNRFELYCMIFYVLDAEWDENHNETLEVFLSEANPYTFTDR